MTLFSSFEFRAKNNTALIAYFVELDIEINVEEEREKLTKELDYYKGFIVSVQKKLGNERFVNNAPAAVVEKERQKLADGEAKIQSLQEALEQLN